MAGVRGLGGDLIWIRLKHVYCTLKGLLDGGILFSLPGHLFDQGRVHALPKRAN